MTKDEIAAKYLEEAKGDTALAFENLCRDAAERLADCESMDAEIARLRARIDEMNRNAFNRRANFSIGIAPKPRQKAIDE